MRIPRTLGAASLAAACGCGLGLAGTQATGSDGGTQDAGADHAFVEVGAGEATADAPKDAARDTMGRDVLDAPVDVGGDVPACVNTRTDPLNCGSCGHSCLGGACVAGACQPIVLATLVGEPRAIAVDASFVYWSDTNSGNLSRVPLAGGVPVVVAATGRAPHSIALDVDRIFWADSTQVGYGLFSGGPLTTYAVAAGNPRAIAFASGLLFYGTTTGVVESIDESSFSTINPIANSQANPLAVATFGPYVYWVQSAGASIMRAPLAGGAVDTLVTGETDGPVSVAADAANVYFTTPQFVKSAPLAGPFPVASTTIASGQQFAQAVAVDASGVYWVDTAAGTILVAPLAGGPAVTLAQGESQLPAGNILPDLLALDSVSIYWADSMSGDIKRLAK